MANPIGQFINGIAAQFGNPRGPLGGIIRMADRVGQLIQGIVVQLGFAQPQAPALPIAHIVHYLTTPDQTETG